MKTYITLTELNRKLRGKTPFLLMWTLDGCPDCYAVLHKFLPPYLDTTFKQTMPLYLIETKAWRVPGAEKTWESIKDTYGLSNKLNIKSGYSTGFVPSFQVIVPDGTDHVATNRVSAIIHDMFVFQNEFVTKRRFSYFISESYFNGLRATSYLGAYQSEIGKRVKGKDVKKHNMSVRRYDVNAAYLGRFLDYYWRT